MSYSPTVYCASMVTPSARARFLGHHRRILGDSRRRHRSHHLVTTAGIAVEVLDQPRRGVGVDMIDQRPLGDVDLLARDERRHGNDDGEFLRRALEVAGHRQHRAVAVAREHDLRRAVEQRRVGLRDVEAAERAQRFNEAQETRGEPDEENEAAHW
jgi:hypothetical protein